MCAMNTTVKLLPADPLLNRTAAVRGRGIVGSFSNITSMRIAAQVCLGLLTLLTLSGNAQAQTCGTAANPVICENALPGSNGWQISGSGDASIQGFATDISVNVGQT